MDHLKKLAVLLSGLGIIVFVTWTLTVVTGSGQGPAATAQNTYPAPRMTTPPDPVEAPQTVPKESPETTPSPQPEVTPTEPPPAPAIPDSIASADRATPAVNAAARSAESPPRRDSLSLDPSRPPVAAEPLVSGRVPMGGNPNSVFVSAAARIVPAVVSIQSSRRVNGRGFDFFHHFRWPGREEEGEENEGEEDENFQPGSGSGIIISDNGFVMTNYHVVEDASDIRVMLADRREYSATMIGGDPTTDVALLKIEGSGFPAASLGNSDSVQIGEWVMAVGNPLNFTSTVTTGIVSALGRNINIIDSRYTYRIENFIQTDAVINPGNSGGALVNLSGEVVGINTAIATRNGFYQGYGFAIPINLARKVVSDLERFGRVRRAILGVVIDGVNNATARASGLEYPRGALVQGVTPGSPARRSGIQQGDIITAVNGREVVSVNDLQLKIAGHYPGEQVVLTVWRDGAPMDVEVVLAEAPGEDTPAAEASESMPDFETLGINSRVLTDEERDLYQVDGGVFIESVASGSPAERAGMYPGAVIMEINDAAIGGQAQFERLVNDLESGGFAKLRIKDRRRGISDENTRIVFVEVP